MQAKYRSGFQCGYRLDQGQRQNKKDIFLVDGVVSKFFGGKMAGALGVTTSTHVPETKKFLPYMLLNYSSEGLGRTRGKPLLCTI